MAFTEFYCDAAAGSNLNGGAPIGGVYPLTYASGTWVQSTGVFTVASGNPSTDGVTVGDFASVYPDATTGQTVFIGRVTARDATTITVSLTAKSGTAPVDGTTNTTIKVGGAWLGPNAAVAFPFGFINSAMNNGTNLVPRVNFKAGTSYAVTAAMDNSSAGIWWQGYTTTPGDGGKATIDGGESGSAYGLLTSSGAQNNYWDLIFTHNGATGGSSSIHGINTTGARTIFTRCVAHGFRSGGWYAVLPVIYVECETYDGNRNNTTSVGAWYAGGSGSMFFRCYSHHNAGTNGHGFSLDTTIIAVACVSHSNGGAGYYTAGDQMNTLVCCDAYNNTGHGLHSNSGASLLCLNVQNCNFVKNGGYGIYMAATVRYGVIYNCGFGAGTQANASGQIIAGLSPVEILGSVTYANDVTPWVDPANGDFRINLDAATAAGRGAYTQTYTSESARNTVGYPDIGAAQRLVSAGGGTRVY